MAVCWKTHDTTDNVTNSFKLTKSCCAIATVTVVCFTLPILFCGSFSFVGKTDMEGLQSNSGSRHSGRACGQCKMEIQNSIPHNIAGPATNLRNFIFIWFLHFTAVLCNCVPNSFSNVLSRPDILIGANLINLLELGPTPS